MRPRLLQSGMTGSWYIVTRYRDLGNGRIEAITKYALTDEDQATLSEHDRKVREEERERLRDLMRWIDHRDLRPDDWACAECRPNSDMLIADFRCAYHAAAALLSPDGEPRNG